MVLTYLYKIKADVKSLKDILKNSKLNGTLQVWDKNKTYLKKKITKKL